MDYYVFITPNSEIEDWGSIFGPANTIIHGVVDDSPIGHGVVDDSPPPRHEDFPMGLSSLVPVTLDTRQLIIVTHFDHQVV